jgi:preprotein translocase subunit YajC
MIILRRPTDESYKKIEERISNLKLSDEVVLISFIILFSIFISAILLFVATH